MTTIAIIPARGGSKRIPGKNIRPFHGRPMIAWPIAAARASGLFDRIVVSTDDPDIAAVARAEGAELHDRGADLSDDHVGIVPVLRQVIADERAAGHKVDEVCLIYATAPFLRAADLRAGHAALRQPGIEYALSVTSYPFPIQRAVYLTGTGRLAMFQPEHLQTRSQDLTEAYHDAAQFCWARAGTWLGDLSAYGAATAPVILPRHLVQDIDTQEDWTRAELMFRVLRDEIAG